MNPLRRAMMATDIPTGKQALWRVEKGGHHHIHTALFRKKTLWMTDDVPDLKDHRRFIDLASGRVLLTGLGLGCVLRGLMHRGNTTHITVVESKQPVIDLVWPHIETDARLVHRDAYEYAQVGRTFDFAWHDIWELPNSHDPALLEAWAPYVGWQGCWESGI